MKRLFIIAIIALSLTSCKKKCYHCVTPTDERDFCDGEDYQYDYLENGMTLTNNVGYTYDCEKQ